jgi:hypothetical protein
MLRQIGSSGDGNVKEKPVRRRRAIPYRDTKKMNRGTPRDKSRGEKFQYPSVPSAIIAPFLDTTLGVFPSDTTSAKLALPSFPGPYAEGRVAETLSKTWTGSDSARSTG